MICQRASCVPQGSKSSTWHQTRQPFQYESVASTGSNRQMLQMCSLIRVLQYLRCSCNYKSRYYSSHSSPPIYTKLLQVLLTPTSSFEPQRRVVFSCRIMERSRCDDLRMCLVSLQHNGQFRSNFLVFRSIINTEQSMRDMNRNLKTIISYYHMLRGSHFRTSENR